MALIAARRTAVDSSVNDRIAVFRREQQLVVKALALNVDEDRERVELDRNLRRLQQSANLREHVLLDFRECRDECGDRIDGGLLAGHVLIVELREEIVDRAGMRNLAECFDGEAANERVLVIEERKDVADRLGTADDIDDAQQQRDHFIFFRVLQRFENRRDGAGTEIDQRLRRNFGRLRLLEIRK